MFHQPTTEQITTCREQGFLLIENFLTPDELEHWRATTMDAVSARLSARDLGWPLTNQAAPDDDFYSQVFKQCLGLAHTHAGVRDMVLDARLGELVGALAGVDGIRIWHDQALTNGPRRAMTCAFMPAGSTFSGQKNVLPQERFDALKIGDVLDSDFNPLIWSK